MHALFEHDVSIFRGLLKVYDESSDVSSQDGWGVLHAAVYLGRMECVALYVESERVPVAKKGISAVAGDHAYTALHIACARGDETMLENLLVRIFLMI